MTGQTDNIVDYLDYLKNQEAVKRGDFKEIACLIELGVIKMKFDDKGRIIEETEEQFDSYPIRQEYIYKDERLTRINRRLKGRLIARTEFKHDNAGNCIEQRTIWEKRSGSNPTDIVYEFSKFENGKPKKKKMILAPGIQYEYEYDEDGLLTSLNYKDGRRKNPNIKRKGKELIIEAYEWGRDVITIISTLTYSKKEQLLSYSIEYVEENRKTNFVYEYGDSELLKKITRNGDLVAEIK